MMSTFHLPKIILDLVITESSYYITQLYSNCMHVVFLTPDHEG